MSLDDLLTFVWVHFHKLIAILFIGNKLIPILLLALHLFLLHPKRFLLGSQYCINIFLWDGVIEIEVGLLIIDTLSYDSPVIKGHSECVGIANDHHSSSGTGNRYIYPTLLPTKADITFYV